LKAFDPFHWFIEFFGIMNGGGFDVIVGNPPWVEYPKIKKQYAVNGYETLSCNNLWAFVTERSYQLVSSIGRVGLIVPMSLVCTERMGPVQKFVLKKGVNWFANFESDSNPGQLFDGVKQNVTILLGKRSNDCVIYTTRLLRFFTEFRDYVFGAVQFVELSGPNIVGFGIPKANDARELSIIEKISRKPKMTAGGTVGRQSRIIVHRIAHYYIKCFDFIPYFWSERDGQKKSEDYKEYLVSAPAGQYIAAFNSSTFYLYWQMYFDAFKAGRNCVESFPIGDPSLTNTQQDLCNAASRLMDDIKRNSNRLKANYKTTGAVEYDQFFPRQSKGIMDEIDRTLARHYGFSLEETDFIINYDIKFRVATSETESDAEVREDGE